MKKLLKFLLLARLIFNVGIGHSQNQNKIWYFGDHAGLDFNSGSPVPLLGSSLFTNEGCSSIADNSGNLLFYTDGITVWNKVHAMMPNGFGLMGNPSTTQSSMITPMPGSTTKYYLFTIDQLGGAMRYSIVDMTLAGGLGDVTATKNVLLHPAVSEKQCAIQKCDGNIWIISHESTSNMFYVDLVTPSGISPSITSSVGTSHAGGGGGGTFNTVGQLKISQQGNKLALAIRDVAVFEVFDFDINTGVVSNPVSINPGAYPVAYGVEFSPDGSKLYGGVITGSTVYQFNLLAGSPAAISASATAVGITGNFTNSLQLGTDGKIYVAKSISQTVGLGYLDVINNPNASGAACSYVSAGVTLGGNFSLLGLPGMMVIINSSPPNITLSGVTDICVGQSTTLTATGATSYTWSGGTSATTSSITVSPAITTTYYATSAVTPCGSDTDTIVVTVHPLPVAAISGTDTICQGESTVLTASGGGTYQWSGGSVATSASINVSPAITTVYNVIANNGTCNSLPFAYTVVVHPLPNVTISGQDTICQGSTILYNGNITGGAGPYNYLWSTGSTSSSVSLTPALGNTSLGLSVTDQNGCKDSSVITIASLPFPIAALSANIVGCSPLTAVFSNESINASSYSWNFGDGNTSTLLNPSNLYTSPGTYNVTLIATSAGGCSDSITVNSYVTVNASPVASIHSETSVNTNIDGPSTTVFNDELSGTNCVLYFGDGDSLVGCNWTDAVHNYQNEGTYTITQIVTNADGCSDTAKINVTIEFDNTLFAPNAFTPGGNGLNDIFKLYGVGIIDFKLMIFDRWGEMIFQSDDINKGWDGFYKGNPVELGVYVWKANYDTKKLRGQFRIGHVTVIR
ncbi:MAG: PKD domain-containing protein [Bacteroidia bacterium]